MAKIAKGISVDIEKLRMGWIRCEDGAKCETSIEIDADYGIEPNVGWIDASNREALRREFIRYLDKSRVILSGRSYTDILVENTKSAADLKRRGDTITNRLAQETPFLDAAAAYLDEVDETDLTEADSEADDFSCYDEDGNEMISWHPDPAVRAAECHAFMQERSTPAAVTTMSTPIFFVKTMQEVHCDAAPRKLSPSSSNVTVEFDGKTSGVALMTAPEIQRLVDDVKSGFTSRQQAAAMLGVDLAEADRQTEAEKAYVAEASTSEAWNALWEKRGWKATADGWARKTVTPDDVQAAVERQDMRDPDYLQSEQRNAEVNKAARKQIRHTEAAELRSYANSTIPMPVGVPVDFLNETVDRIWSSAQYYFKNPSNIAWKIYEHHFCNQVRETVAELARDTVMDYQRDVAPAKPTADDISKAQVLVDRQPEIDAWLEECETNPAAVLISEYSNAVLAANHLYKHGTAEMYRHASNARAATKQALLDHIKALKAPKPAEDCSTSWEVNAGFDPYAPLDEGPPFIIIGPSIKSLCWMTALVIAPILLLTAFLTMQVAA